MASTAPARRGAATKAVVPASLSSEDLLALLGQTGDLAQNTSQFHRMTLRGGILETDDGEMFPPRKEGPSVTLRIVSPPDYYNAFFLDEGGHDGAIDGSVIGRSDLNGRFVRKYDDPAAQARDNNPANDVYDEIARVTGGRGSFKGDMQVQIVPESGEMTGEETVYTLSLSTTSVFEFRGSSRNPGAGSVSDTNFIVKLAELAVRNAVEAGADEDGQKRAIIDAMTALRTGGVIAEVYLLRAENEKKTQTWTVISFVPIFIDSTTEAPALESGDSGDDVPF